MRLPLPVVQALWRRCEPVIQRMPDEIIGHKVRWRALNPDGPQVDRPFLLRWYIDGVKHRSLLGCNRYIHQFIRDDEDRALHDHPWANLSILLGGQYIEHTIESGGVHKRTIFSAGDVKFRSAKSAHRVELRAVDDIGRDDWVPKVMNGTTVVAPNLPAWCHYDQYHAPSWSLFITGPAQRKWGFHCPETGWRSNREFTDKGGCS